MIQKIFIFCSIFPLFFFQINNINDKTFQKISGYLDTSRRNRSIRSTRHFVWWRHYNSRRWRQRTWRWHRRRAGTQWSPGPRKRSTNTTREPSYLQRLEIFLACLETGFITRGSGTRLIYAKFPISLSTGEYFLISTDTRQYDISCNLSAVFPQLWWISKIQYHHMIMGNNKNYIKLCVTHLYTLGLQLHVVVLGLHVT